MEHLIEEDALEVMRRDGKPVRIIFNNGYQTDAVICSYDRDVITCKVNGHLWLVYKHNVSTIVLG